MINSKYVQCSFNKTLCSIYGHVLSPPPPLTLDNDFIYPTDSTEENTKSTQFHRGYIGPSLGPEPLTYDP